MATTRTYAVRLWQTAQAVGKVLGVDFRSSDLTIRAMLKTVCVLLAVLIKLLVDLGRVTDAQLSNAFDLADVDSYDAEPVEPVPSPLS